MERPRPMAVFYDPEDPRRGVLAEAFADVVDDPEDESWTSWLPWPGGEEPGKRMRAELARAQWAAQVGSHDWRRKDTLVVAAIYSAANFGVRDDFMRALEARVGPKLTRSSYVTADRGWVTMLADLGVSVHRMDLLLNGEAYVLDRIEYAENVKETAVGVGVVLAVLGAAWLGTR